MGKKEKLLPVGLKSCSLKRIIWVSFTLGLSISVAKDLDPSNDATYEFYVKWALRSVRK